MLTIEQTMPNLLIDGGIFKTLPQYGDYSPVEAGFDYCLNHSGLKPISRLTQHFLNEDNEIDGLKETALANMVRNKYKAQWDRAWEALMEGEYDPLSNTSRNFTHEEKYDGEDVYHMGAKHQSILMKNALQNKTNTVKTFAEINQGANGNDKEKYEEQIQAHNDENVIDDDAVDNSTEYGKSVTITDIGSGNVGTMTTQYLINEELKLRAKNFYDEVMFPCIDNELTIAIYGNLSNMSLFSPADLQLVQTENGAQIRYKTQVVNIENGADGQDGQDGRNGVDGVDGKDGKDGVDGKDGKDGKDGVDGINGADGRDGQNGLTPILSLESNGDLYVDYEEVNPNE